MLYEILKMVKSLSGEIPKESDREALNRFAKKQFNKKLSEIFLTKF